MTTEKCAFCSGPPVTLVAVCGAHEKLLESLKPKKRVRRKGVEGAKSPNQ